MHHDERGHDTADSPADPDGTAPAGGAAATAAVVPMDRTASAAQSTCARQIRIAPLLMRMTLPTSVTCETGRHKDDCSALAVYLPTTPTLRGVTYRRPCELP